MWSGPRNLSTAMMRAFENRPDTAVIDEPFYGAYLHLTGVEHPLREAVMAATVTDWRKVVGRLSRQIEGGPAISYEKHITTHMLPEIDVRWMARRRNAFLIRAPERVLASYARRREAVTAADIGFARQAELFDREADRLGTAPPVLDAEDVLADPRGILRRLCHALGISFVGSMLSWPVGSRPTDGVWAPVWYGAVQASTGFAPLSTTTLPVLDSRLRALAEAARPSYERLALHTIKPLPENA
ncbi:MAG: hypothetical protein ABI056_01415 [Caulobacteraceae bacterium]